MAQYPAVIELSDLDGTNGFQIIGEAPGDRAGLSVGSAGDINNDGFDDIVVGAFMADSNGEQAGATYVLFGTASGFASEVELSSLDGNNGFQISGEDQYDQSGFSVAGAGDVNGDGVDDLIIGALIAGPMSGAAYVVFGTTEGFVPDFNVSSLDGSNGFRVDGVSNTEDIGYSVSSAGDVNGDGIDDIIMEAGFANSGGGNRFGAAYVVFGNAAPFAPNISLVGLNGSNGFKLNCKSVSNIHRIWVAAAGDVNGDGIADLLVGARVGNGDVGAGYVVFGKAGGIGAELDLADLDGTTGFKVGGLELGSFKAPPVASAGDINGDGYDDIVLGAPYAEPHGNQSGAAYVVFGHANGFDPVVDVSTLDGTDGFKLLGEAVYDRAGCSVASAGDVNGDGFDDLIVGAYEASPNEWSAGSVYVVFGGASGFSAKIELSDLDGNNGFKLNGETEYEFTGLPVASAGDLNNDGFADVVMGANGASPHGVSSGASYVYFGGKPAEAVVRTGTEIANTIHGGDFDDTLSGLGGADTLIGHNHSDSLYGGNGNDGLNAGSGNDTLDGGRGDDVLNGGAGRDLMGGGAGANVFVFDTATESTGRQYDTIKRPDCQADSFDVAVTIAGVDAAIATGSLSKAGFSADLSAAADDAHLLADHAVLFTPDSGGLAGKTFLVVDLNGLAGYQGGEDLVIRLVQPAQLDSLGVEDFL